MIYIFLPIFLYIFLGLLLYLLQRKILFNQSKKPEPPDSYGLQDVSEIYIKTQDNINLLAWHFKGSKNLPLLVYFHGNSFNIGERAYRINRYIEKNWSVLLVAWRGYSGNHGKPTEKNLYIDGESTINWVKENTDYKNDQIIVYGESLGSGVAVQLGTKYKFLSIVLEAPFTSISEIAKKKYPIFPTKFLVRDNFDNYNKILNIKSPLMIISGKKDEIVPHSQSLRLFNKAQVLKKSVFIDEAMHNNLYDFGIEKSVIKFNLELWK